MNEFNNKLMGFYKTLTLVELLVPSSVDKTKSVDASLNSQVGAHEFDDVLKTENINMGSRRTLKATP